MPRSSVAIATAFPRFHVSLPWMGYGMYAYQRILSIVSRNSINTFSLCFPAIFYRDT